MSYYGNAGYNGLPYNGSYPQTGYIPPMNGVPVVGNGYVQPLMPYQTSGHIHMDNHYNEGHHHHHHHGHHGVRHAIHDMFHHHHHHHHC